MSAMNDPNEEDDNPSECAFNDGQLPFEHSEDIPLDEPQLDNGDEFIPDGHFQDNSQMRPVRPSRYQSPVPYRFGPGPRPFPGFRGPRAPMNMPGGPHGMPFMCPGMGPNRMGPPFDPYGPPMGMPRGPPRYPQHFQPRYPPLGENQKEDDLDETRQQFNEGNPPNEFDVPPPNPNNFQGGPPGMRLRGPPPFMGHGGPPGPPHGPPHSASPGNGPPGAPPYPGSPYNGPPFPMHGPGGPTNYGVPNCGRPFNGPPSCPPGPGPNFAGPPGSQNPTPPIGSGFASPSNSEFNGQSAPPFNGLPPRPPFNGPPGQSGPPPSMPPSGAPLAPPPGLPPTGPPPPNAMALAPPLGPPGGASTQPGSGQIAHSPYNPPTEGAPGSNAPVTNTNFASPPYSMPGAPPPMSVPPCTSPVPPVSTTSATNIPPICPIPQQSMPPAGFAFQGTGQPPEGPQFSVPPGFHPGMLTHPMGQPHMQQPMGQPHMQQPMGQPHMQQPMGQPHMQQPMGQPHMQQPMGQPHMQQPMGHIPPVPLHMMPPPIPSMGSGPPPGPPFRPPMPMMPPVMMGNFNRGPPVPQQADDVWVENRTTEGKSYYYNMRTRETRWDRPDGVSVVHQGEMDHSNPASGGRPAQSLTTTPSSIVSNKPPEVALWTEYHNSEGKAYYHNTKTGETTWEKPKAIIDWEENGNKTEQSSVIPKSEVKLNSITMNRTEDTRTVEKELSNLNDKPSMTLGSNSTIAKTDVSSSESIKEEKAKPKDQSRPISSTAVPGTPWCVVWTGDERAFFFNPSQRLSVWEKPEELKGRTDVDRLLDKQLEPSDLTAPTEVLSAPCEQENGESEPKKPRIEADAVSDEQVLKNGDKTEEVEEEKSTTTEKIPIGMEAAREAEEKAARERAALPLEVRVRRFREMLVEMQVSAFSTWEKELHKIVFDPRYLLLTSKERKQTFETYVKERAEEERREKKNKQKERKEKFMELLEEADLSSKSIFNDFSTKYTKDERFKGIEKSRDRELMFQEFLGELRKREKDEKHRKKEKTKTDFIALLKEQKSLSRHSHWSDLKRKIDSDARYKVVNSSSRREDWFRDFVRKLEEKDKRSTQPNSDEEVDRKVTVKESRR